jgi:hypothetical protein
VNYVVADVSRDPTALSRVNVSDEYRARVLELGCERVGFLGSFVGAARFGFVAEVLRCKDPSVVAALYNIGRFGEGIAFWTLLDDGTIVTTERRGDKWPLGMRARGLLPIHHQRARVFNHAHKLPPAELLEKHLAHVRAATRGSAQPVKDDPFRVYAAVRIRSGEIMGQRATTIATIYPSMRAGLVVGMLTPWLGWVGATHGARAVVLVLAPSVVIAFIATRYFGQRLAWALTTYRFDTPPPPPSELLARAARIPACMFENLPALALG